MKIKKLIIDYFTKDIIEIIFNLHYQGNSYQTISNILNEEKVLGKPNYHDSSTTTIFENDKQKDLGRDGFELYFFISRLLKYLKRCIIRLSK